jgi:hypothetical protein
VQKNEKKGATWLPSSLKEMKGLGWERPDVILFTGDAYIDHPSFGAAIIARVLEAECMKGAVVPQPNWRDDLRDLPSWENPVSFLLSPPGTWIPW